ncbi:unnamed protein product [Linum trigynum]|uniref:RNase H type-1 domain-containing protein n=1 Tax=Linum trigynum TaxID=586398 RepID=A0AAV2D4J2_9ROSI
MHQVQENDQALLQNHSTVTSAATTHSNTPQVPPNVLFVGSFDAGTRQGEDESAAFVIRHISGDIIAAKATRYTACSDPYVLEALALRDCLVHCTQAQLQNIHIQGDAKVILDKCRAGDTCDSKIGILLQEIVLLLQVLSSVSLQFVGRLNNRVAHSVAKHALGLSPRQIARFDYVAWLRSR